MHTLSRDDLQDFLLKLGPAERIECGLDAVSSPVFAVRDVDGPIVSACGYEHWPAHIAQLCVATDPEKRRRRGALATAVTPSHPRKQRVFFRNGARCPLLPGGFRARSALPGWVNKSR